MALWSIASLEDNKASRSLSWDISALIALDVEVMAACWARRGGSAERFELCMDCICWVRVWERAERRASFWGLGGIGGGAILTGWVGRAFSKGEVRRSSGGFVLGNCGGG